MPRRNCPNSLDAIAQPFRKRRSTPEEVEASERCRRITEAAYARLGFRRRQRATDRGVATVTLRGDW